MLTTTSFRKFNCQAICRITKRQTMPFPLFLRFPMVRYTNKVPLNNLILLYQHSKCFIVDIPFVLQNRVPFHHSNSQSRIHLYNAQYNNITACILPYFPVHPIQITTFIRVQNIKLSSVALHQLNAHLFDFFCFHLFLCIHMRRFNYFVQIFHM